MSKNKPTTTGALLRRQLANGSNENMRQKYVVKGLTSSLC